MTHLYFGKVCFRAASGAGPAHISTVLKWGSRSLCHHSALVKSKDTIERIHIYPIHRIDHDASPTASNPYRSDLRPLGAHNTISKLYLIISRYRALCVVNSHDYDAAPCCEVRVPQKRSIALSGPNSAFYVSFAMTLDFYCLQKPRYPSTVSVCRQSETDFSSSCTGITYRQTLSASISAHGCVPS